jgi:predicted dehydrogenase
MSTPNRREFLVQSTAAALAVAAPSKADAANDRITVGVIGCGGMGSGHARALAARKDVAVAYACDPDDKRSAAAAKSVETASGRAPKTVRDLRQVLDDKTVDAVWIATCDHWHAPAAILAADAGKHVYVEKPCAHNLREGRLMIEAARRNKRVMQVGTQRRSNEMNQKAAEALREGAIGEVLVAKVWNSQLRSNIGRGKAGDPPATLDYDLWVGPAPMRPYQSNLLHYNWHWFYDFGTGDIGNDGVHQIDLARWGLGVDTHPVRIAALGGKYFFDDDQEFPDTHAVVYEFVTREGRKKQLLYEQRIWAPYSQEGEDNGNAFYGTKGMMLLGRSGWQIFGQRNAPGQSFQGKLGLDPHHTNFLECIRSGARPNADIEINHYSSALCHLGNIAARVGRTLRFDPEKEAVLGDEEADRLVRRAYRPGHWAAPKGV